MVESVGTIAQKVLRRLGVRVVPLDDSPTLTEMVPLADIAAGAALEMGLYTAGGAEATSETVSALTIAKSAQEELAILNNIIVNTLDPGPIVPAANIINNALIELGVIAPDEIASSYDATQATVALQSVHHSLSVHGIALWGINSIPTAYAEDYTKLTAAMLASSFGKAVDTQAVAFLESRVRTGAIAQTANQTWMMERVNAVHHSLEAQGLASWGVNAIPLAFRQEYTQLTVAMASATFGKPADPAVVAAAEARIRAAFQVTTIDQAFLLDKAKSVHASLDAQGLVWWSGEAVPRAFAEEYIKLTVAFAAMAQNKPVDSNGIALLEARVRRGVMVLSSDSNAAQAVQDVHDDYVARGIARWSSFDIPEPVAAAYLLLATFRAAPLFDKPQNPMDLRQGELAIARYVALPSSGERMVAQYF